MLALRVFLTFLHSIQSSQFALWAAVLKTKTITQTANRRLMEAKKPFKVSSRTAALSGNLSSSTTAVIPITTKVKKRRQGGVDR